MASLALFGIFLGMAVLAKGPAGIILAGGAIGIWAIATQQWKAAVRLAHPIGITSFCIVALPWYVLCALRNPEFIRVFLVEHNFQRYLTPVFQHRQPFWFFAPILLLALFPWTALLFPAAMEALRLRRERSWSNSPGLFFACWTFFPLLFFSVSQSKLPGYILPAIPAARTTICGDLSLAGDARCFDVWTMGFGRCGRHLDRGGSNGPLDRAPTWWRHGRAPKFVLLLRDHRDRRGLHHNGSCVHSHARCAWVFAPSRSFPRRNCRPSPAACTRSIHFPRDPKEKTLFRNDRHLDRLFTFELQRSWSYGLAFYLNRQIREWSPSDPEGALVLDDASWIRRNLENALGRFHGARLAKKNM